MVHWLAWLVGSWFLSSHLAVPIVDLGYARYQGYFDPETNITKFLGIRYAAPPVDNLRFQAPRPPVPKSDVQLATQNPSQCYQAPRTGHRPRDLLTSHGDVRKQSTTSSEDCLFLNVFVPGTMSAEPVTTEGLPVLVWIHGGGYRYGNASRDNAANLVADSLNNVVVVAIQYRLGLFGFLSGDEVEARGALNAGLLDQNFALQWVQEYIELFGGDRDQVTIWGDSAGGGSVLQHIVANAGNTQPPLFNAAITSSAYFPSQYKYNHRVPQSLYNHAVDRTGCGTNADTFSCLQSVDTETLQAINYDLIMYSFYPGDIFVPVVDGRFIVERPTVTLSKGRVNGQVYLGVSNQNEGAYSIDERDAWTISQYISLLYSDLKPRQVQEAAYIYQGYGTPLEQAWMVYGDSTLSCPTYYLLEAFAGRSWKGFFAIPPAYHANDIDYYFHSMDNPPPYNNKPFITAFSQSFISLAMFYDVNSKFDLTNITPYWPKYNIDKTEMLFNHTEAGVPVVMPIQSDASLLQRCAFWASVTADTWQ